MPATKSEAVGHNLFAYCGNEPIVNIDPSGFWCLSLIGFTIQGGGISGGFVSIYWVFDNHGNQGILITAGVGLCTPQVSITWSPFFSWRRTIYDLKGISYVAGGGTDFAKIGIDFVFDSKGLSAVQFNLGITAGVVAFDLHGYTCATELIPLYSKTYNRLFSFAKTCISSFKNIYRFLYFRKWRK